ncbi:unnamed protein product, partial [Ixodes persulcatus]
MHRFAAFIADTQKHMQRGRESVSREKNASIVSIPYVRGVSDAVRRALRPLGIQTVFKPHYTLANVFPKPKDRTPADVQSGVVYKVQCGDCDATYIGETGRKRTTRLKEHKRDVAKATHATRSKTELVDHCWTTGHTSDLGCLNSDLNNAATLSRDQRWGPRKLLESWFIRCDPS